MPGAAFCVAAALSTSDDTRVAVEEVCRQLTEELGAAADLTVVFFSAHHAAAADYISAQLNAALGSRHLLGATGEAIVGGAREIEGSPALAVWAARMPGVEIAPLHLDYQRAEGGSFVGWPDSLATDWPGDATLLLLADAFTFPADVLLERLGEDHPGLMVLGGMASGAARPGENRLLLDRQVHSAGAVAVLLSGGIRVHSVVSQGCRPIGKPMVITKAQQNVVLELGGKPALAQLRDLFETLPPDEQQLLQNGLQLGRVINEYQAGFNRGDFLIRNVLGFDAETGAIAIGDFARVGQTVQFHVRDAQTADDDLRQLLARAKSDNVHAAGALLFTCNGRGTRLFSAADHDARTIHDLLGGIPVAGFFAHGEIGPIGGQNFLHGFTAAVALFESTYPELEMKPFSEVRAILILAVLAALVFLPTIFGQSQGKAILADMIICALPVVAVAGLLAIVPRPHWGLVLGVLALGVGVLLIVMELSARQHTGIIGAILAAAGVLALTFISRPSQ